jgi:hypothetical protein
MQKKFTNNDSKLFYLFDDFDKNTKVDLVLSCDVLYHLIEDDIYYNYLYNLFNFFNTNVIIYAKNENKDYAIHVKFRKFTKYISNK